MSNFPIPLVRAGRVVSPEPACRISAYFPNSAQGNQAIQIVGALGVPMDRLGVTPPDRLPGGQGMLLSIACGSEADASRIERHLLALGATLRREAQPGVA